MDYLDPVKLRNQMIVLYAGYVLMATAVILALTLLLVLVAGGYHLQKNGQVVQNGLLFMSSRPAGATVILNGKTAGQQTNHRFNIAEGSYNVQLQRAGYRTWQHQINVVGGNVVRYDYPLLFPQSLVTTTLKPYTAQAPGLATITPDNRWLLVQLDPTSPSFDVFDLNNPKLAPTTLTIPATDYAAGGNQSWQLVDWAGDKVHLLLEHGYGTKGAHEFVLVDRQDATQSVNLSDKFGETATEVDFAAGKFDHYYVYSSKTEALQTANLSQPQPQSYLSNVLAFEPYQSSSMLYVTPSTDANLVNVDLRVGDQTYLIRQLPAKTSYRLAINSYSGSQYVAVAAKSDPTVYLYKDPINQISNSLRKVTSPFKMLSLKSPGYLTFSVGGRLLVGESGTSFVAYDALYKRTSAYDFKSQPIDKGQPHATWMDGAHLQYVSKGQLYVFDYDGTNVQLLMPAVSNLSVFYDGSYHFAYALAPPKKGETAKLDLTSTALLTPADQ